MAEENRLKEIATPQRIRDLARAVHTIECYGKRWKWDEDEGENFSDYHSQSLADAILKYINKNDPMQMLEPGNES